MSDINYVKLKEHNITFGMYKYFFIVQYPSFAISDQFLNCFIRSNYTQVNKL